MRNRDVEELFEMVAVGDAVELLPRAHSGNGAHLRRRYAGRARRDARRARALRSKTDAALPCAIIAAVKSVARGSVWRLRYALRARALEPLTT